MSRKIGYIRVSTKDQNENRQLVALKESNVEDAYIYIDKQSGKDFERPEYIAMVNEIKEGDVLYVKSIDRLGRNYTEIMDQWRIITKEKKADIIVLDMPLLDTTKSKNLLGTFISDIVLQLLSFVAENERDNIRKRQREGIDAAKARGVKFGQPQKKLPDNFHELFILWQLKKININQFAEICDLSVSTLYKRISEYKKKLFEQK